MNFCDCELRNRAWDPNTHKCRTCGAWYVDTYRENREDVVRLANKKPEPTKDTKPAVAAVKKPVMTMATKEIRSLIGRAKVARAGPSETYETLCRKVRARLTPAQREQLNQFVVNGPLFDGDVNNKSARDDLRAFGDLLVNVIVKGQDGYTAATYLGKAVNQAETLH